MLRGRGDDAYRTHSSRLKTSTSLKSRKKYFNVSADQKDSISSRKKGTWLVTSSMAEYASRVRVYFWIDSNILQPFSCQATSPVMRYLGGGGGGGEETNRVLVISERSRRETGDYPVARASKSAKSKADGENEERGGGKHPG